jgi:peptidoglycan hydrolase-like protein with peptidoglycan-binding domain
MSSISGFGNRSPIQHDPSQAADAAQATGASQSASASQSAGQSAGPAPLSIGARGEGVKKLQTLLNATGAKIAADGIFGRGTAGAVAAFQKSKGLPATGAADAATMAALEKAAGPKGTGAAQAAGQASQTGGGIPPQNAFKNVKLVPDDGSWGPKTLTATIGGKLVTLADDAIMAKASPDGRFLAWTNPKGAGGFENEGQGMMIYDAKTGKTTQVMSEYFMAEDIKFATSASGKSAILVPMTDGGLGLDRLAVVDPERGEVGYYQGAKLLSAEKGKVTYKQTAVNENGDIVGKGNKTLDLDKVLKQPVIHNKREWE